MAIWEEPSNCSGGEPKDLVGFEDAIGFMVELSGVLTVESGVEVWNWGAGNLGCEEEDVAVFGVSGRDPGKVVLGCSGVTAKRVWETDSVAVWRRVDMADSSGSWLSSEEWGEGKRTGWWLKYCQRLFDWDHHTHLP